MNVKLFTSGLFAGLAAGLIVVLLQLLLTEPLILEAELYEAGTKVHFAGVPTPEAQENSAVSGHDHTAHEHAEPADSGLFHRLSLAFAADLVVYVAWGLILVAGIATAERYGHRITLKNGLILGFAGFVAVHIAPGIGLAPELPGIPAADLHDRQIWWIGTVIATAAALGIFAFRRGPFEIAVALALLIAPQVIGAPQLEVLSGLAPPELAGEYVSRSYAVGMAGWVVLGLSTAFFWTRKTSR